MKTVTIEELVSWAFVHELPKGGGVEGLDNANSAWRMLQASSWGKVDRFAELMTLVDQGRGDRDNYFIEQGEPHDDAIAVGEAVAGLGGAEIVIPAGWRPLEDWPRGDEMFDRLKDEAVAATVERFRLRPHRRQASHLVSLVVGTAVLGRRPDFAAEAPKLRMVERGGRPAWFVRRRMTDTLGNVHEIEVDGFNRRTCRPLKGAYRRYMFSDDPAGDILARLDWQLWISALRLVEAGIADKLVSHRLAAWDCGPFPWGGAGPEALVCKTSQHAML